MKTPEVSFEQLYAIQKKESNIEQHVIVPDRRSGAFLTMEDFERKWNINQLNQHAENK